MLEPTYPLWLGNEPIASNDDLEVHDKFTGEVVTRVALATPDVIDGAIQFAVDARPAMAALRAHERRAVLEHCAMRFRERADELAQVLCIEAGKPIRHARGEVERLIDTFTIAAGEATRLRGEVLPLDISPRAAAYTGFWKRVPVGPCAFITPFNFPLNLVAHKVAPAIAAGCPFVLKPASEAPVGALLIGQVLAETGLPQGAFSILPCRRAAAGALTTDERLKLLSFTGSSDVGWELKAQAGRKKVALELGGNAAVIVDAGSDVEDAVARIVFGAFYQSGQSCISVQRILVHETLYDAFKRELVAATQALRAGDPRDEETFVGPLICDSAAERVEAWIRSAVAAGATLLCGGERDGRIVRPALLEDVPRDHELVCDEVFGPVAVLKRFSDFDAALADVNDSRYGLQAGVFTRDLHRALHAWDALEVGGVVIGDVPSVRVDNMPYGGVKESGHGREGVRFAIEEMTEIRMLMVRGPSA